MRYIFISLCLFSLIFTAGSAAADSRLLVDQSLAGQDLYLQADTIYTNKAASNKYAMIFEDNFTMTIGNNKFSSDKAVVVMAAMRTLESGIEKVDYKCLVYLQGNINAESGKFSRAVNIYSQEFYQGSGLGLRFLTTGQVYATAENREAFDPEKDTFFAKAIAVLNEIQIDRPITVIQSKAIIPKIEQKIAGSNVQIAKIEGGQLKLVNPKDFQEQDIAEQALSTASATKKDGPKFQYPVNISSLSEEPISLVSEKTEEQGLSVATITGRFYLWQKLDEKGNTLEMLADSAVVFYADGQMKTSDDQDEPAASGAIRSIYIQGNIEVTHGKRTIRADEMFYDFYREQGLALNSEMKSFDVKRGIPIYVKAKRFRQISENQFTGEEVVITNSEFHQPQVKMTAAKIIITDTTSIDQQQGELDDSSYELDMRDIEMSACGLKFFKWPRIVSDLETPDIPIKSIHISNDSRFGTSVETRWHLSRLLGLKEPKGVESTLALDYFGDRGTGAGAEIEYEGDNHFGRILGYAINDRGKDDLGRTRKNIEPNKDLRGRLRWQHRHYLPYNWQLTLEASYLSDNNFLEGYYRDEFNTGKAQETLVYLKRTIDNHSLSILNKVRLNDFQTVVEELPTIEYHHTGESVFDDRMTFFSDSRISRLKNRYADGSTADLNPALHEDFYTFGISRAELDMPLVVNRARIVPYIAGTFGYDGDQGFNTALGGSMIRNADNSVVLGEVGLRAATQFWKVDPSVQSRFWNLNGIRHIVKPHVEAALFAHSDDGIEQRDIINVGLLQRWQTKRGPDQEVVDWMRLNVEATFVSNDEDSLTGPDNFMWNRPFAPVFFRKDGDDFGIRRDKINADYIWRMSDTTALLSDGNYDIEAGTMDQLNLGVSHFRYPNLSYYIGSRYLRNVTVLGEKGSHALLYAITYKLNSRYTMIFSQEYNFDYGKTLQSELTLVRKYHRLNYALTLNTDSSLDRSGIMFSIWPEGVKELAWGSRKFFGLSGTTSNY